MPKPIIGALAEVTSHKAVRWDSLAASLQRHAVGEGATNINWCRFWRKNSLGRRKTFTWLAK
ncbi:hypothetical protein MGG_17737 [Pyricularia oryzae 70-15]|uniref:Uncharacterized protein n=4 Tax=Pyricularia oryzae TaxID=318829 RepID=G4NHE0_PYRO7|nr:uncharacterized protein MGG_17737 [Pyricularia oryzae 70-15]ELQ39686.1 hypothetical protein OOU_Y34scaffold00487g31 [Pyricularia oryzae Y34]KAI6363325.1 hypothetical protein MCOR31_007883 [Pyricularia oryzae]EHA47650.1 hypothetical protein MGG_17737 [Pyricularia oryzae 70-15]KAI6585727.1 hypothetical protein MCOR12_010141 [Pyricularia oryzae]KAI7924578.1 hypothetical protein M9X92_003778 [Pyricularia oryzae]